MIRFMFVVFDLCHVFFISVYFFNDDLNAFLGLMMCMNLMMCKIIPF